MRPRPDVVTLGSVPPRLRRRLLRLALGLVFVAVALAVYGLGIEPGRLRVVETSLPLPSWPASHAGLRVAVLTDLHVGAPHIDLARLAQVVDETNAAQPDVIVVLGDLLIDGVAGGHFVEPEPIAEQLGRLRADVVVAVLGNHDWWFDGPRTIAALEHAGLVVLENRAQAFESDGRRLWIAGISDAWTRGADVDAALAGIDDGAPVLAITHNPDVFPQVPQRVALTLAGHTHGGQIDVPLLGPPVVPSRFGQRYAAGHVIEDGRHLFVGTGVGTSIIPVRIAVVPRIDVLALSGAP
ncbi:MAG: metallophosphoesterase [Nannocystaceae bacterium]|nr:metallophosphoesterase [Nannocystaceae bacterium]